MLFVALISLAVLGVIPDSAMAQGMMGGTNRSVIKADGHTAREEAEGKVISEALRANETTCEKLSDDDFGSLGEYYMGTMLGDSHEAMNTMMERMMGEEGEEEMHVVMGKRLSGCDPEAVIPTGSIGFMPMMNMMFGGWPSSRGFNQWTNPTNMMNTGLTGFSWLGSLMMILWWGLIIFGIVLLIRWLMNQSRGAGGVEKKPLDILKERYAKGEINNQEFEEKKKNLI